MSRDEEFCALVPMRHMSQRVHGKNFREFCGRPLYRHIVDALLASNSVAHVAIDTDSEVIAADVARHYDERVQTIPRPAHLTAPTVPMNKILLHDVALLGGELFLQTHSTNPLVKPVTIARAVSCFRELRAAGRNDSLFSVTRRQVRTWSAAGRPLNHDPNVLLQTQDLEPFFEENSCLYLFSAQSLAANANRIGAAPAMFEIDPLEAIDIDEESDFVLAEALFQAINEFSD
jgi:CMP-N-acetylneuraminic acid synthetase